MSRYWANNSIYFLTGSTFLHFPYFKTYAQKMLVLNQVLKVKKIFRIPEIIFSISINHYHLKFYLESGLDLAKIKQMMHGGISYQYHKIYKPKYKEMWQSFRALVISSEEADWRITGYIIGNLLKHKEVSTFRELKENPFSSYKAVATKYGEETARKLVYEVIDINEDAEGVINMNVFETLG